MEPMGDGATVLQPSQVSLTALPGDIEWSLIAPVGNRGLFKASVMAAIKCVRYTEAINVV